VTDTACAAVSFGPRAAYGRAVVLGGTARRAVLNVLSGELAELVWWPRLLQLMHSLRLLEAAKTWLGAGSVRREEPVAV
jgi:hypothetical protein